MPNRYEKLTDEQIVGANYMLRVLYTSPVFRGKTLKILEDQNAEIQEEWTKRHPSQPVTVIPSGRETDSFRCPTLDVTPSDVQKAVQEFKRIE